MPMLSRPLALCPKSTQASDPGIESRRVEIGIAR